MQGHLPDPQTHRIYFDQGTVGLDDCHREAQAFADVMLHDRGYTEKNFQSRTFPGGEHTGTSWATRVQIPLEFLTAPMR